MLNENLAYFIRHQAELVEKYGGTVLILKDCAVVGSYPDELRAFLEAEKRFHPGTFSIQRCEPGPEAYTTYLAPIG